MMEWTQDLPFSRSYLVIVIAVAVAVGGLAVFGQSSTLALAAAVLGLYVLHLFSNWQLASNQRQQWHTLREVERMLGALDGERDHRPGAGDVGAPVGEAQVRKGADGSEPLTPVGEEPVEAPPDDVSPETPEAGRTEGGEDGASAPGDVVRAEEEEEEGDDDTVLVPRQYRLGTVAVVRRVLTPGEVARVLAVQDRQPGRQFGDIAMDLGLLTESELEELLRVQQEGLYRPAAIGRARRDLQEFRREKAQELGTGP